MTVNPSGVANLVHDNGLYNAFPVVLALKSGRVLATWRQDTGHQPTAAGRLLGAWSGNGGTTWTDPFTVHDTAGINDGGGFTVQWPDGEVGCMANTNDEGTNRQSWFLRSVDDGLTWGPDVEIGWTFTNFSFGCDLHLVDDGTADGRLLAVAYGADANGLLLDGAAGSHASTPDAAALDIAGDIDIRVRVAPDDWTPAAAFSTLVSKLGLPAGTTGYELLLQANGTLILLWGDGAFRNATSTVATGFVNGTEHWVRATLDVNNGAAGRDVKFYTSDDGVAWVQLGATVTQAGVTSITANANQLRVGARADGTLPLAGTVGYVEVRNGIDGTVVADPDFAAQAPDASPFADDAGNTWTVNGGAVLTGAEVTWSVRIAASTDRGATWSAYSEIVDGSATGHKWNETQLLRLPDGTILATVRVDNLNRGIHTTRSVDNGATWTALTKILPGLVVSGQPAIADAGDTLVLAYRTNPDGVWSFGWAESHDLGVTWSPRGDFTDGSRRMMYVRWARLPSGDILAVYGAESSGSASGIFAMTFPLDQSAEAPPLAPAAEPVAPDLTPGLYRYMVCDAATGAVLDADMPMSTDSLPSEIGRDTTTTFHLPLEDPRLGSQSVGVIDPRRIPMIAVLRNDQPVWIGLITTDRGMHVAELGAVSLEGWFARRLNTAGTHTGDMLDVARALLGVVEGEENLPQGIAFEINSDDAGVIDTRTYEADQVEDILAELTELAGQQNGFEWTIDFTYDPDANQVTPRIRFGYPALGVRSEAPETRWELGVGGAGGNLEAIEPSYDCSAGKFATHLVAVGAGEGETRLVSAPAIDLDRETATGLRVEMQTSYSEVSVQATINAHAARDLDLVRNGETLLTAVARLGLDPTWGQFGLGDDVRVVIEDTPRFPRKSWGGPGLDVVTRLLGWRVHPETDTIDLILAGGVL